jgi:hypothetical protein
MTNSEQHPSNIATKTGQMSQWFRISQNGLLNASVGFILLQWRHANEELFQENNLMTAIQMKRARRARLRPQKSSYGPICKGIPCC